MLQQSGSSSRSVCIQARVLGSTYLFRGPPEARYWYFVGALLNGTMWGCSSFHPSVVARVAIRFHLDGGFISRSSCYMLHHLHCLSTLATTYFAGIYKKYEKDCTPVTIIARTGNVLMMLACLFAACRDGRTEHSFVLAQFDCQQGGFNTPLPRGVMEDANKIGFCDFILKSNVSLVQSLFALKRREQLDWSLYPAFSYSVLGTIPGGMRGSRLCRLGRENMC